MGSELERPAAAWSRARAGSPTIPNAAIAGTQDAPLYRSCRYDLGTIRLRAPDGTYKVTLKFCEPHFDAAGERICDVHVQGSTVLTNLDIFAQVGKFAALDFTFDDVAVTDGALTIELIARKSLPCISAIAVEGAGGFTSKINCGGAAYQDWQADTGPPRACRATISTPTGRRPTSDWRRRARCSPRSTAGCRRSPTAAVRPAA